MDQDLLAGIQRGDRASFDAFYARWRTRIYGFLFRLLRHPEVAEDLLQETWLRFASHAHRLRTDTDVAAWLFTVARNLATSYHRWHALGDAVAEAISHALPGAAPTPFDHASGRELEARLELALESIPFAYREVLLLTAVERLDPDQAAVVLHLKPEAFRKRLSRARTLLQARLEATTPNEIYSPGESQ